MTEKVIWDEVEMLKGAVVEEVTPRRVTVIKDGKRFVLHAVCYQCGDANIIPTVESSEAPPQRG